MSDITHDVSADAVLAAKGRSFHWARRLLGKKQALRATRLYRFCRYIDDVADEADCVELANVRLLEVQQAIICGQASHPVLVDGINLMAECDLDSNVVLDLIAGVLSDTTVVRIEDEYGLLRYCYQVAGTVGLMMCKVLDSPNPAACPYAIDLGIAMQLTNICRDIKTDALMNRRYLPANLVDGLEPAALIDPTAAQQRIIRQAVATLLTLADRYYQSGELGLCYLPLRARGSILVAARVYHEIGVQLRKENYSYWQHRIIVSTPRKLIITLQSLLAVTLSRKFWRPCGQHDGRLNQALHNLRTQKTATLGSHVD